jgi:hypothetical protein
MATLSYAGIPLKLDLPELRQWVEALLPLGGLEAILDLPDNVDEPIYGLTRPRMRRKKPKPAINQLYYPNSATQWAEGYFLLDEAGFQAYLALATPTSMGAGPTLTPFPFIASADDPTVSGAGLTPQTFTTNLFALPPRPLSGQVPGFYLLPLVDERYWWQFQGGPTNITGSTTWAQLYSTLASALGITFDNDLISTNYLVPCNYSALDTEGGNYALLLDAVAANLGQTIVRSYDGTYYGMSAETSNSNIFGSLAVQQPFGAQIAGNLMFTFDPNSGNLLPGPQLNNLLPAYVTVYFPKKLNKDSQGNVGKGLYVNPRTARIPFGETQGDLQPYTVTLNEQTLYQNAGIVGYNGFKTFYDTCPALLNNATDATPINNTDLGNLSQQIALDYWASLWSGLDLAYGAPIPWTPEGSHDLIITFSKERLTTRVRRLPWNYGPEQMLHWESGVQVVVAAQTGTTTFNPVVGFQCINGQMQYEQITVTGNFVITNSP